MSTKGCVYYTDNRLNPYLFGCVHGLIEASNLPIVSCSLKPTDLGYNVVVEGNRSYPTMISQIITALETSREYYVFFCEHDVLYHKTHFDFTPPRNDIFYYNRNVWRWKLWDGKAVRYERMLPLSVLCVNREFALQHYKFREKTIQELGWDRERSREPRWVRRMGYEPGTKKIKRGGITDDDFETWQSEYPVIDVRHKQTFSRPKVRLDEFKHTPKNWQEISLSEIPGWNYQFLERIKHHGA